MGIEFNNDQIYALYAGENWYHKGDRQVFEVTGGAGSGKAQPLCEAIPTPNGYTPMGELKTGDYVFNQNGEPVKITGVYDRGTLDNYEVLFEDGSVVQCNDDHLWGVYKLFNGEYIYHTRSLKEIMTDGSRLADKCTTELYGLYVQNNLAVEYPAQKLGIDPYSLGLWYSEIPYNYMIGSIDQRWDLVRGIFDSKGNILCKYNNEYYITCESQNMTFLNDVKKLLASLGYRSRITDEPVKGEYTLYVYAPNKEKEKFFCKNHLLNIVKQIADIPDTRDYTKVKMLSVRKLNERVPMRCIYVDTPSHLYLTDNYIVTHNTTMICALIDRLGISMDHVLFVAFMGKAAAQMARHGLPARTAHSAFYDYVKVPARDENGKLIIKDNGKIKKVPDFVLKDFIQTTAGKTVKLIVIDEGSQITDKMAKDILSFGIPTIVLGDLNQLPPVFGNSYFLKHPDVELHQIMRQKENDPIVIISRAILAGERLRYGVYGKTSIISKRDLTDYQLRHADIILTGTNRLRYNVNNYVRENIKKIKMLDYPHIGEKVICRKNNWKRCIGDNIFLTNGTAGFVDNIYKSSFNGKTFSIDFRPDFTTEVFKDVTFDYKHMYAIPGEIEEESFDSIYNDKMEFAYAITTHACLPLSTLVYTEDGIKPLGSLKNYTGRVYNGSCWEKPSMYIDNGYDKINAFTMNNGFEYKVTDFHKCKVLTSKGICTKYGKDVHEGDSLLIRKGMNLYTTDKRWKFENQYIYESADVRSVVWNLPIEMSEELAELIGMMCADGTIIDHGHGIRYVKGCKKCADVFAKNIKNIFGYDAKAEKIKYENAWSVEVHSCIIGKFFYDIKGLRPNKKYVPECILCSSEKYHCAFLRGLFEDGTVHLKNGIYDMIELSFKNPKMKNQLATMLLNMGIKSSISIRKKITPSGKLSVLYTLYIFKYGGSIFKDKIGFINDEKNARLETINSTYEKELNTELGKILCNEWSGPKNVSVGNVFNSANTALTSHTWKQIIPYIKKNNSLPDEVINFIDNIINNFYILKVKKVDTGFAKTACLEMPKSHVFLQDGFLGGNSQGSQYPNVTYLREQFMRDPEDQKRLDYTAVTRAMDAVTIVQ